MDTSPVGTATPAGQSAGLFGFKISEDLFNLALIAVAVILGIIVLLAILAIVRNQVRQRRENTELNPIAEEDAQRIVRQKEEERRTALQTRHIAELEQQARLIPPPVKQEQQLQQVPQIPAVPFTVPVLSPSPVPSLQQVPGPTCPHCHQPVQAGALFCANCGFSLSPSAGLQTRVMTLPVNAPQEIPPAPPVPVQQPPDSPEEHVQDSSQEQESVPNCVGQRLGNYQLMRLLGEGGFAEVYLGEHIHLGSQAAIKVLYSQLTSDERERFRQEARTLVRLVHPHIVRVLEFGIEDKTPFLVMDYAANGTLRGRHPKGTRLPLATVITYIKQVADALQYAHDQKIIHRDIKPENMLVGRQHEILLSDFGIATVALSSRYQNVGDMAGTIAYMAPEQIQAHPRPASDQYALGVVIYEWLCGTRPFQGLFAEIAVKHAVVPPPSIRKKVPTLPLAVEEVVFKALAKDPKNRFENVREFAQALVQAR